MVLVAIVVADDPLKQATMVIAESCRTKVGATKEDLDVILSKKLPTTKEGVCLVECLLTRGNMMKNGKFNKPGFVTAATPALKGDADKIQKLKAMADACEKELASATVDHCEMSKKVIECTTQKGKSFGFKFPSRL